ncbi:MAG: ABC-F family ATP-binding cassette domain-containing protein [Alistipes sp.]|nr:ABC-F family ATP-binding cassette domain-containing protein [Alistipes sp.]
MASYLQVENISKSYGDKVLFQNISFNINEGDKIALIAPNGTGKSSLLKILAGLDSSDRGGEVKFMKDIKVAFLDQINNFNPQNTLFDEVYSRLGSTYDVIRNYEQAIASGDERAIERAMSAMDAADGWSIEQRIKQVLSSLKLSRLDQHMGELSGGEAKRAAIALMLLQDADFLVMDEPTNHLDIDVIEYLESYLQKARCTLLMVTHDRYFLDRVCNTIFELDRGELYTYKGNYSLFLEKREERYNNMQANIDKARNLLRRELEWIRATPQARTGKARYRINAFYDLKDKASVSLSRQQMNIDVASSRLGGKIIDCEDVCLNFGERKMLDDFSYKFSRYERVGIVGKNGAGKSTFLNLMTGMLQPDSGSIERGETLRIGYYRQQGIEFKSGQTVLETVQDIAETITTADGHSISATAMLNRFLFPVEALNKRVDILSGGEQRRLYLLTVLMRNPNFLILDEPTNDLDILTLNILEEYLQSFKGCLLIVSHDRYFLDKTVGHLFIFREGGNVKDFVGTYSEYREYIKEQEAEEAARAKAIAEKQAKQQAATKPATDTPTNTHRKKLSYKEQRELEQLEAEIPQLEAEKSALEAQLSAGTLSHEELSSAATRIGEIINTLEEKEMRWLELSEI